MTPEHIKEKAFANCKKIKAENLSDPIVGWGQNCYFDGFIEGYEHKNKKMYSQEDIKKEIERVKEQFRKDVDSYGKPKKLMSSLDSILTLLNKL